MSGTNKAAMATRGHSFTSVSSPAAASVCTASGNHRRSVEVPVHRNGDVLKLGPKTNALLRVGDH